MESDNHFSNSTVDVGEVVTTSMTLYVSTGLTQVGAKYVGSIEAVKFGPATTRVVLETMGLGKLR